MSSSRRNVSIMLSLRPRRQRLQCETLSERAPDALGDALHQRLKRCAARRCHMLKHRLRRLALSHRCSNVNAIEKQHVRVNAEAERAAKPLDQRHGTRSGRAARASCRAQQIG
jgi:hypothetical protein